MRIHANPDVRAQAWDNNFPGQIGDTPVTATTPRGNTLGPEGDELRIVDVGHSDADKTSVLHVPPIGLVVMRGVVYNGYPVRGRAGERRDPRVDEGTRHGGRSSRTEIPIRTIVRGRRG